MLCRISFGSEDEVEETRPEIQVSRPPTTLP